MSVGQRPPAVFGAGLLLAGCLLLGAAAASAQAYKWRDADGKLHFSDTPPPDRPADKITIKPQVPENPEAAARGRDWRAQLEESATRRHLEQKEADAQARNVAAAASKCSAARSNLGSLQRQQRVYRTGSDGQKVYLDDKDRPAAIAAAQERVDRYCR